MFELVNGSLVDISLNVHTKGYIIPLHRADPLRNNFKMVNNCQLHCGARSRISQASGSPIPEFLAKTLFGMLFAKKMKEI